ncbi:MAG: hypothetical protein AAF560_18630 [Acidobacteriota bacterium]
MSDVLFRYLLTARRRDQSVFRRWVLQDEPLLEAGVEQLVETAAARVQVTSQHEQVDHRRDTVPASRHRSVRFYDKPQPQRPTDGHFEERSEEFPLRDTLQIYRCDTCRGSGRVRCQTCTGRGELRCSGCGGSGRVRKNNRRFTCATCGGSGRQRCFSCRGSGRVSCPKCRGEGQLATWQVDVFIYRVERRTEDELPEAAQEGRIKRSFIRWLATTDERLANLERFTVAQHLGFETDESLELVARADAQRQKMEEEAQRAKGRFLFLRAENSVAPVGYTVVRLDGKARYYWLIGRGEKAIEVIPRGRPDSWKCAGLFGFGSGSAMAYEGVAQTYGLAQPIFELLNQAVYMPLPMLVAGSTASWLVTLGGLRRIRLRRAPVFTVGLITSSGRPSAYLTCLAYLGSYLERLQVLDRHYDAQSDQLLGRMRSDRQSESLSVALADGRKIRMVEVAQGHRLSDAQLRLMAQALDGVMILEEPGHAAAQLLERLNQLADKSPQAAVLRIDHADGELRSPPLSPVGEDGLPLEGIRRAFVADLQRDIDWELLYQQLWQPIASLLNTAGGKAA